MYQSQPCSQLLLGTDAKRDREARERLADRVRYRVFKYDIYDAFRVLHNDNSPSFGRGLLRYCYERWMKLFTRYEKIACHRAQLEADAPSVLQKIQGLKSFPVHLF